MLSNKWTWIVVGVIVGGVAVMGLFGPESPTGTTETVTQRQARCKGYFKRMDENHESGRAIIPEADYQFCLDYSHEYYKK